MIETLINEGDIPISNSNIEQLILASPSYSISLLYFQLNSSYRSYSISFTGTNNLTVNNPHYITDQRLYLLLQTLNTHRSRILLMIQLAKKYIPRNEQNPQKFYKFLWVKINLSNYYYFCIQYEAAYSSITSYTA